MESYTRISELQGIRQIRFSTSAAEQAGSSSFSISGVRITTRRRYWTPSPQETEQRENGDHGPTRQLFGAKISIFKRFECEAMENVYRKVVQYNAVLELNVPMGGMGCHHSGQKC